MTGMAQSARAPRVQSARASSVRRRKVAFFILVALFFACAPLLSLKAQSGRRRPEPSASPAPNTQRPRRATPTRPAENAPGQPATPDAPSSTVNATPTPASQSNTPRPQASDSAAPAASNSDESVEIDEGDIVRVSSNLVPVSATVTDARGKAITDLTVDDFELRVDGQPKPIGGLSHAETPVRMVMLFDNSLSQTHARELEKQAAMRFFRRVLRPIDQAAVISFATEITLEHPFTNDVGKLVRSIDKFGEPEGATKLLEAIVQAADYLKFQPGRKVIVLISDGQDSYSNPKLTFDETLRTVLAADCQVYSVQTGIDENLNIFPLEAVRRLEILSDRTGGTVLIPKGISELDAAFTQISADLAQQYVLSYYPTEEGRDGRFRVISLRVKTRPNLRVRARRGYYPRLSAQQLSSQPGHFVSASDTQPATASRNPQPSEVESSLTISTRELTGRNARSTITLGGPVHGSKNMDAERSGESPARTELDVRVSPVVRPPEPKAELKTEPTPAPPGDESPPEPKPGAPSGAKPQPDNAPPRETSTGPTATPAPTATTPTASNTPATAATENNSSATSPPPQSPAQTSPQQPSAQSAPQTPLNVGHLNSKALSLPKPIYPQMGKQMRLEGTVKVAVVIDESGKVISARAESGHMMLRPAAVAAARQAKFTPALVSGQPVPFSGFITYTFSL